MNMKLNKVKSNRWHAGIGLIEIMIALLLGVIIMLGVTEIATNNSKTRYELQRSARQIEDAAYALRLIESDLTNSAYWGERGEVSPGTLPALCPTDAAGLEATMGYPLQGGVDDVDCPDAGSQIEPKAGTEYLAIRRANSCAMDTTGTTGCEDFGNNFHIQVHACFNAISTDKPGDFAINNVDTTANFPYTKFGCADEAPKYRFLNRVYYVNDQDELVRVELEGTDYTSTTLVENIEMLRFEYGVDTDQDGQVDDDGYPVDPNDPIGASNTWPDVVMVKIYLVVRNDQPSSGYRDTKSYTVAGGTYTVPGDKINHRRNLYTRTVSMRNIAGRREVPAVTASDPNDAG